MKKDFGIIPSSKTLVRCIFCGVHLPKANRCIEQHTNGAKHKENLMLMRENAIYLLNEDLYCKPCNRIVNDNFSVPGHVETESHSNWKVAIEDLTEGEFIKLEPYLSSERDDVHCEVCNLDIDSNLHIIEKHVNSTKHRNNVVERLKPLNGLFPVENDDEVFCKICNMYIDNTTRAVLEHIDDDEEHVAWLTEIEDLIEGHDVSIEHYLANDFEVNAYCKKCKMDIICDVENIESHVHSEDHLNKFI
ncbi:uncharacterized protein LOC113512107 [Galleria mellonella]|uniref:Uncharacterized protein LOC113512107 n=1 Tax=Galleria mellonella TaxID=7137 RepID=A0A6J1WL75_GALME|nr:uncharacterized protein LOC113512107 [Galleria mellonella]